MKHHNCKRTDIVDNDEIDSDYNMRFGNMGRLYSSSSSIQTNPSLNRLRNANVCVIGLGGVGSWVVEALARSGIGRMT